ncbi:MAG: hypothetical protein ACI9LV_000402 [Candidatus Nanohaloarchaea archaeon]|jgi:hypothetical protein
MGVFRKVFAALALPILGYYLPRIVIPFVSTAPSAASEFSTLYIIGPAILLSLSFGFSYLISRLVYPRLKTGLEKKYQNEWVTGLFPTILAAIVSFIPLYFIYVSCNFTGGGPECQPVSASIRALYIQISHNGLYLRLPHIEGIGHVASFLGYWLSSIIVLQEIMSRAIFYMKNS